MYKSKKFEDLTISDDFMFGIVMRDPKYCKPFLETILNIKISQNLHKRISTRYLTVLTNSAIT